MGECLYRSEAGSYFAVVKHLGRQHRKSLQTTNRGIAVKRLGEFRQKLRHLAPSTGNIPTAITFGQVATMWLESVAIHLQKTTYVRRLFCIDASLRLFKTKPIGKITLLDCERWATARNKLVKGRTFNYDLETLRLVFVYAISHGLVMDNPAAGIRRRRLDTALVVIPSALVLGERISEPPYIFGNFPRIEIVFALVDMASYAKSAIGMDLIVDARKGVLKSSCL